ncbi:conserved exported hypothetical protein [Candidatus Nitrotoga sp. BS]|uniref:hypothetical protein n=1 Tax=Candidatus Nitrotoga sp. BS TaxID=2890408 RepID=UPI001EF1AD73|nr:hypothetical protein [Candidatus Nitrotoga sp. BS]CAH1194090.1 conserved exported hypothetical protein [Candidatus Nitrotoga sp. BS]
MKVRLLVLVASLISAPPVAAYKQSTHEAMSRNAVIASDINKDSAVMSQLGLPPFATDPRFSTSAFFASPTTILELFAKGANDEDDGLRSLHHFFNPLTNASMYTPPWSDSPDWAVSAPDDPSSVKFSFKQAREYLWQATANPLNSYAFRQKQFGMMFESLGHVIHHLEDMTQPQHVRDDQHCDIDLCRLVGQYSPSLYESFTAKEDGTLPFGGYDPVYSSADTASFNTMRNFWTTTVNDNTGKGIAEYTNRGFVSKGTNLDTTVFAQPALGSSTALDTDIATLCGEDALMGYAACPAGLSGAMTMYSSIVTDNYRTTAGTRVNSRTSTQSIFDQDLQDAGGGQIFSLNRFNFHTAQSLLIPRAVGYSAGLINYFFRGKMQISLPPDGVYSLIDGTTTGFSKVKLGLTNASPPGEDMTDGTLVAVAKFHRNTCYADDLSDALNLNGDLTCRSEDEEIVVSAPQTGVTLGNSPTQFTFDFSEHPIPKNATDLYIQAVYRGQLGSEADAVVVATKDISEPTYFSYHNDSDYIQIAGHVYTRPQVNANPGLLALVKPTNCVIASSPPTLAPICFQPLTLNQDWIAGNSAVSLYTVSNLPVRSYTRVVLLTDAGTTTSIADKIQLCQPDSGAITPVETQLDLTTNTFKHSTIRFWRGSYGWEHYSCAFIGDGSAPGTPDDRSNVIAPRTDGAATPTAVQVLF